ncbi:MAG: hypothetical protein QOI20_2099 [Acidimicrobiaceae bacterium]|jgi:hypothetical protein|nr:hypothetical protein [Acidimicrobiaceae bacterium]
MNPIRKGLIGAAVVGSTFVGGAFGAALINSSARAETTSTTSDPAASTAADPAAAAAPAAGTVDPGGRPPFDPARGGHMGANGVKEALLTGTTADKVKAAALAAVPGGTVERVENDAEGATYEAHMTKADGSDVTVKLDDAFKVTSIEDGHR